LWTEAHGIRGHWTGWIGIRWLHITFGYRNVIERFFRTVKEERTRRFYNNNLPSDRMGNLESFLNLFMVWYNHLRRHQGLRRIPVGVSLS